MRDTARFYRESAVRSASPVGLIVILYEETIRSLRKAQRALKQKNIEQRTLELTHAIKVIGHLQSVLDFDRGGAVARNLWAFYNTARTAILSVTHESGNEILESLAADFSNIAQAWQQVDREITASSAGETSLTAISAVHAAELVGASNSRGDRG
jgi:flagellar protein FliS